MAPARPRPIDDSRSETSSLLKEKSTLGAATGAGVAKTKKTTATGTTATSSKAPVNGVVAETVTAATIVPRTDWASLSPLSLLTYRTAYRLPTASCYTSPHADIAYASTQTALRAPSTVLARKRMHEFRQQQRLSRDQNPSSKKIKKPSNGTKPATKDAAEPLINDHLPSATSPANDTPPDVDPIDTAPSLSLPLLPPEQIARQTPASLANAVRKHFNAQQLNEAETIAKFLYVVRDNGSRASPRTAGSGGDGHGWTMGSQGREVRKGEGGEVGFRLRFRP